MTSHEKAALIGKIVFVMLIAGIVAGVVSTFEWKDEDTAAEEALKAAEKSKVAVDRPAGKARTGLLGLLGDKEKLKVEMPRHQGEAKAKADGQKGILKLPDRTESEGAGDRGSFEMPVVSSAKGEAGLTLEELAGKKGVATSAAGTTGAGGAEEPLLIFHHHLPGDATSEALADVFNFIQAKYGARVEVTRVDFRKRPEISRKQGVSKPPHVVMFVGSRPVFQFQGPASREQVDRKVHELLVGMQRMSKDWRPPVPGMKAVGS